MSRLRDAGGSPAGIGPFRNLCPFRILTPAPRSVFSRPRGIPLRGVPAAGYGCHFPAAAAPGDARPECAHSAVPVYSTAVCWLALGSVGFGGGPGARAREREPIALAGHRGDTVSLRGGASPDQLPGVVGADLMMRAAPVSLRQCRADAGGMRIILCALGSQTVGPAGRDVRDPHRLGCLRACDSPGKAPPGGPSSADCSDTEIISGPRVARSSGYIPRGAMSRRSGQPRATPAKKVFQVRAAGFRAVDLKHELGLENTRPTGPRAKPWWRDSRE